MRMAWVARLGKQPERPLGIDKSLREAFGGGEILVHENVAVVTVRTESGNVHRNVVDQDLNAGFGFPDHYPPTLIDHFPSAPWFTGWVMFRLVHGRSLSLC